MFNLSFGKKEKVESTTSYDPAEWKKAVDELSANGGGLMKVYRQSRNSSSWSAQKGDYIGDCDLSELKKERIEPLLADNFGGGLYLIHLVRAHNGLDQVLKSFKFSIAGEEKGNGKKTEAGNADNYMTESLREKEETNRMLLGKMLENKNGNLAEIITLAKELSSPAMMMLSQNQGGSGRGDVLEEVQAILAIAKQLTPEIKAEDGNLAMLATLAQPFISAMANKMMGGQATPQQSVPLSSLPLPDQKQQITQQIQETAKPLAEKPPEVIIEMDKNPKAFDKIEAFDVMFLSQIKDMIKADGDIDMISAKIFGAVTISIIWFPDTPHPKLKPILDCLQNGDFINLQSAYDTLSEYLELTGDMKSNVLTKLIELYKLQVGAMEDQEDQDMKEESPEEVGAGVEA